jgi:hypothetical protein
MKRVAEYETLHGGETFSMLQVSLYVLTRLSEKKQYCPYWWNPDPCSVVEDMLIRCIMDGAFEQSSSFSILKNKMVVVFGGDKGGTMYSLLTRIAN